MIRRPDIVGCQTRNMGAAIRRMSRPISCRRPAVIVSRRFRAMSRLSRAAGSGVLTATSSQATNQVTSPIHAADMVARAMTISRGISKVISSQVTSLIRVAGLVA